MASHGVKAELNGLIDLVAQNWALQVNAIQTDAAGEESQDAAHLTLDIAGPWSQPTIRATGEARPSLSGIRRRTEGPFQSGFTRNE